VNAAESYWEAVEKGRLPISLVIETSDGVKGIATVVFSRQATKTSDVSNPASDKQIRAESILRAMKIAKDKVEAEYEGIRFGQQV
jgi:hypothetical protein